VEVEGTCTNVGGDLGGGAATQGTTAELGGIGEERCGAPWWTSAGHTGGATRQGAGEADAA
jgi:hypothetical protein